MKIISALMLSLFLVGCADLNVQWVFHAEYGIKNEPVSK